MSLTGEQIRLRGLAALKRELGRAGLARFLQHYEPGTGNYARDRKELLAGLSMDDVRRRVRKGTKRAGQRRG